jgi:uncharacterized protein with NRDE domain
MCTVSIVPGNGGFTMISNRDERRDRASALEPRGEQLGSRAAILPIDPVGGGSWIGVNDAGLVAAVLNRHAAPPSNLRRFASRGLIIRHALSCDSLGAAADAVQALAASAFRPFRLVLVQSRRIALIVSDGGQFAGAESALEQPCMFTASSLGDVLVDSPRRRLFECLMNQSRGLRDSQLLFHRHQWKDKRDISVLMERADAATVSRTVVDAGTDGVALEYESLIPCQPAQRVELRPC